MNHRADRHAEIIRPEHNRQNAFPERQMQEANREQPAGKPGECREAMLLDLDFFHII